MTTRLNSAAASIGSEYKIEYEYSSLRESLDCDLFSFFFTFFN